MRSNTMLPRRKVTTPWFTLLPLLVLQGNAVHTGWPGGIKETDPSKLMVKKPEEILKLAVKRMLPRGPLGKKQLSKLKIYKGNNHPHESQNLKIIDFGKMNSKNYASIN